MTPPLLRAKNHLSVQELITTTDSGRPAGRGERQASAIPGNDAPCAGSVLAKYPHGTIRKKLLFQTAVDGIFCRSRHPVPYGKAVGREAVQRRKIMNVLLINGSPHKNGCTYTALNEVAGQLNKQGIETHILHIGSKPIRGCIACGKCVQTGACIFDDDPVNECVERLKQADGLVVGSPVYYASPSGALISLLDRVFYGKAAPYAFKPAAAVVSCRRGGATASLDVLNKYFTISQMPVVSSQYWNMVHGNTPDEVRQDAEGLQIMRTLGNNMAWMIKSLAAARNTVPLPEQEAHVWTNFIR